MFKHPTYTYQRMWEKLFLVFSIRQPPPAGSAARSREADTITILETYGFSVCYARLF